MQARLDVGLPYVQQRAIWSSSWGVSVYTGENCLHVYFITVLKVEFRSYVYSVARDCDNGKIYLKTAFLLKTCCPNLVLAPGRYYTSRKVVQMLLLQRQRFGH